MAEAKFSDGYWGVSASDATAVITVHDGPDADGHEYRDGRHQHILARMTATGGFDLDERMANARLMASAKAMHAALKALVADHGGTVGVSASDDRAVAARAALAQAGE